MRKWLYGIILITVVLGAVWYYHASPQQRVAQAMLTSLENAAKTQQQSRLTDTLKDTLQDTAKIRIEIDYPTPPGQKTPNKDIQEFDKTGFLHFLDNILYTARNYHLKTGIVFFSFDTEKKTATLIFTANEQADSLPGSAMDGNTHFTGDSQCLATMQFVTDTDSKMSGLTCATKLHFAETSAR